MMMLRGLVYHCACLEYILIMDMHLLDHLNMQEVVKKEIIKLLDVGIIYPIVNSEWVSPS